MYFGGQSKTLVRRYNDGDFLSRYFVGSGIDIGGGGDSLMYTAKFFPLITAIKNWDMQDGDGQYLKSVPDKAYDFLHSSHSLEHMVDVRVALANWIRVAKRYLVITVPDEDLYERGHFPSIYNTDHKHTFTIHKNKSWSPVSINILDLCKDFSDQIEIERINLLDAFFDPNIVGDQTRLYAPECAVEFIWKVK